MSTMSNISSTTSNKNVVDTAAANGSFKTFGRALRQAGMADALKGDGPFTLFAPTDAAFEKLPAGQLDGWLKPENKEELMGVLNYHVLAGRSSAAEVGKLTVARTVHGQAAPIVVSGTKVSIDGAELTAPDLACSNGVVHGIDKVNVPTRQ